MPSEREIRKLYVNGRTICIEFSFAYFKFSTSAGCVAVTEGGDLGDLGGIPQQAFWAVQSGQNRETYICFAIACQSVRL